MAELESLRNGTAETITFEQLEEVIFLVNQVYGFDFFEYSRASLKRRVTRLMDLSRLSLFDLKNLLVNDEEFFEHFMK